MNLIILGSGFDLDLGLRNSFGEFSNHRLNPACGAKSWSDFERNLREQIIYWYNHGMDDQFAKQINQFWQIYRKNLSYFFTERSDDFLIDPNKCAYKFLQSLSETCKVYTFNYTDPYEYIKHYKHREIIHIHGVHHRDTFKKELMVMSQYNGLVLGVDSECIPLDAMENKYIKPIAKIHQRGYSQTNIVDDLSESENIIFFGFSMNEVDFGYFRKLFHEIENGLSSCKRIVYINLNENAFHTFCNNLRKNGVNLDLLVNNVNLQPYYTEQGSENEEFYGILKLL